MSNNNNNLKVMNKKFNQGIKSIKAGIKNIKPGYMMLNTLLAVGVVASSSNVMATTTTDANVKHNIKNIDAYNKEAIEIGYNNNEELLNVAREIIGKKASVVDKFVPVSQKDGSMGYKLGDYLVTIMNCDSTVGVESTAQIMIQKQETVNKMVLGKEEKTTVNDGAAYIYNVKTKGVDKEAPVITLTTDEVTLQASDNFNPAYYIANISDNEDQQLGMYNVDGTIAKNSDGKNKAGEYTITYHQKDASGNEGTASLKVKVEAETPTPAPAPKAEAKATDNSVTKPQSTDSKAATSPATASATSESASDKGAAIAAAALAQVGVSQDCTMLVTNSIMRATGKYFHGWPTDYYALGDVVSNPQPGDICVYPGHVAIYIGNGQAVHGGWNGGTTAVASVNCSAGSPVYVRVR